MQLTTHELTNLRSLIDFARGNGSKLSAHWNQTASDLYDKIGSVRDEIERSQSPPCEPSTSHKDVEPTAGPYYVQANDGGTESDFGDFSIHSVNPDTCFAPIADLVLGECEAMEPDGSGGSRGFKYYELTLDECRANAYLLASSWELKKGMQLLLELSKRNTYEQYWAAVREIASGAIAKTIPPAYAVASA